jgi:hypothetical protein
MEIRSNKSQFIFHIFCTFFIFILINGTIVLNIGNSVQVAFSQGYIPPTNIFKSESIGCPQVGFSGPTYKGQDGCPRNCPTSGDIPKGCPQSGNNPPMSGGNQIGGTVEQGGNGQCSLGVNNGIGQSYKGQDCGQAIGNQTGKSIGCPQVGFSGPTYKGQDGCPRPCPNNTNDPNVVTGQVYIPECQSKL